MLKDNTSIEKKVFEDFMSDEFVKKLENERKFYYYFFEAAGMNYSPPTPSTTKNMAAPIDIQTNALLGHTREMYMGRRRI